MSPFIIANLEIYLITEDYQSLVFRNIEMFEKLRGRVKLISNGSTMNDGISLKHGIFVKLVTTRYSPSISGRLTIVNQ